MSVEEKPKSRPANENPWYCLATIYGEQEEGVESPFGFLFDRKLADKNRLGWNRWMATGLSEAQRNELIKRGYNSSELVPLANEERDEFVEAFAKRKQSTPPEASATVIDFIDVHFERAVSFGGFVFPNYVIFNGRMFDNGADFRRTAFCDGVQFSEQYFGLALFIDANFFHNAFFDKAELSGVADFSNSTFQAGADFKACEFKSHTDFAGAKFLSEVPDFRDAKLSEAAEWHGVQWPTSPKNEKAAQRQVYAYERLKAEMEQLKKHEDEQSFFAKELNARRALLWFKCLNGKQDISKRAKFAFGWLLNTAYSTFSGYGQSVSRPLIYLFWLFVLGAGAFAMFPSLSPCPIEPWSAAALSISSLLPLLPYKPDKDIIDCLSPLGGLLGNTQSFLGVILLFLLGLALRNRFRMK